MKFSKILIIVCIFISFIIGSILGYNLGTATERKEQLLGDESFRSFWGIVQNVDTDNNTLLVSGIPENDINHRIDSYLTISDKTLLMNSESKKSMKLSELKLGDMVNIKYHGPVMESSPTQIPNVDLIMKYND